MLSYRLDAFVSAAALVKEHEDKPVGFCFPTYIADIDYPVLKLKGFWNPLVGAESVIPNSVEFGTENSSRHAVVKGPNGGGKSTVLRSITAGLCLGLSRFGIFPGESAEISGNIGYIRSSMNPPDSLAEGKSLFQAQCDLIAQTEADLKALPQGVFGVLVLDELYTGTSAEQGAALTMATAEEFAKKKNLVCIFVTHHEVVTELENISSEDGSLIPVFKNYHLGMTEDYEPTFILEEGVSRGNIALQVAGRRGVSETIISRAFELTNKV